MASKIYQAVPKLIINGFDGTFRLLTHRFNHQWLKISTFVVDGSTGYNMIRTSVLLILNLLYIFLFDLFSIYLSIFISVLKFNNSVLTYFLSLFF